MHLSAPFIQRPVATSLLSLALLLAGSVAYSILPVASLPDVDFPVIGVGAGLPGASPETMASSVATPLERQFGRIAGVNQMTSTSSLGSASVTLQFDINRNIDAAARDVQAAINAARSQLPSYLPQNPSYRKANPAESPILILTLTSDVVPKPQIYDMADSILAQKISQIQGVGQVFVGGSSSPAVRVELNPMQLGNNGIGLEAVRTALAGANANRPKGAFQDANHRWQISDNDQIFKASDYAPIIAGYNQQTGAPVRVSDLGTVADSIADIHTAGVSGINPDKGPPAQLKSAVLIVIFKIPGANVISTVDNVMAEMPRLQAAIPPTIKIDVAVDRTTTIRSSVHDVEISLMISVCLVVLVVFLFLREVWATIIPSIAVPLSLVGTFGVMYLLGYTIDNLSLMALTIATGFVVDDAIVVIENITRYLEMGMKPFEAAMKGSKEIGFTVLSMSTSLIAVFIPILLMGGIVGKLFREFAVTLSVAIAVSLLVSLTTTPMLCAQLSQVAGRKPPRPRLPRQRTRLPVAAQRIRLRAALGAAPPVADAVRATRHRCAERLPLHHSAQGILPAAGHGPAGRPDRGRAGHQLPRHARQAAPTGADDAGRSGGALRDGFCGRRAQQQQRGLHVRRPQAAQPAPRARLRRPGGQPPARQAEQRSRRHALSPGLPGYSGGRTRQRGAIPVHALGRESERAERLGAAAGGSREDHARVARRLHRPAESGPGRQSGHRPRHRLAAGHHRRRHRQVLYDAFGQREVSTMYTGLNQYFVVMEVDPQYQLSPDALNGIFIKSSTGAMVPLSAIAHYEQQRTSLAVNHQGQYPAVTLTFNLAPNVALGDAVTALEKVQREMGMPSAIHATFQGTAQAFQDSLKNEPWLILAALVAVYIVLGILYESLIHPLTILSTLPPAGVGAILALMLTGTDLSIIALIGIILLIGIVKKNAIMMIDFALQAERDQGLPPRRGDLSGLPAALPPHHDDDHGRALRRIAAGHRHGRGLGAAQAAGHHHRWRPDRLADAYPVHHAGRLSLLRPPAMAAS